MNQYVIIEAVQISKGSLLYLICLFLTGMTQISSARLLANPAQQSKQKKPTLRRYNGAGGRWPW